MPLEETKKDIEKQLNDCRFLFERKTAYCTKKPIKKGEHGYMYTRKLNWLERLLYKIFG